MSLSLLAGFLSLVLATGLQGLGQHSEGWCSPNVADVEGEVTITCKGIPPKALEQLNESLNLIKTQKQASLGRLDAEAMLQRNRGNIGRCIKNLGDALFLNFFFSYRKDGGLGVDILVGQQIIMAPRWHTRLPGGVYSWEQLKEVLKDARLDYSELSQNIDVSKRLYFISGNTKQENPWYPHAFIRVAEFGEKLSVLDPEANGCIIEVLRDTVDKYNSLPNDGPFLHRYITDKGVAASWPKSCADSNYDTSSLKCGSPPSPTPRAKPAYEAPNNEIQGTPTP